MFRLTSLMRTAGILVITAATVVCGGPLGAQDSSARVTYQVGQVSLMNSGLPQILSVGSIVRAQQMIVTGPDGFAKLEVLSDKSTFEVYPNSKVIFRENPGSWEQLLNVWLGRVKVFIQHAPGVPNPNNVTSPTAIISVRGTVFDVVVENDDGDTLVSVDEGAVQVRHRLIPGNEPLLKPGDSITVFRNQPLLGLQINKGGGVQKALAMARKAMLDLIYMHPGGVGGAGAPVPGGAGSGGAQGDKGKNTGGAGKPPGAPTPPAPPGGGGD